MTALTALLRPAIIGLPGIAGGHGLDPHEAGSDGSETTHLSCYSLLIRYAAGDIIRREAGNLDRQI